MASSPAAEPAAPAAPAAPPPGPWRRLRGWWWPAAALAASLAVLPAAGGDFLAYQVALYLVYGIATQGVALCWGRLGFLPLGQALGFWQRLDGPHDNRASDLGLAGLEDVPVRYLSTGQKKRAALARLIGQQAPLWLLDEPLNGLDTRGVALVEGLVAEHCAAGGIAVIASHQPIAVPGLVRMDLKDFAA